VETYDAEALQYDSMTRAGNELELSDDRYPLRKWSDITVSQPQRPLSKIFPSGLRGVHQWLYRIWEILADASVIFGLIELMDVGLLSLT
jgi:hypothetical protein